MKLSVVIVSYNVKYYLEQCLLSVQRALAGVDAEVIVIDNHSKDHTVESLSGRFPDVKFISSQHNLGFAKANNKAIRLSTGEYVLLLNPDTFVGERTLRQAIDFMDAHPKAGAAGVKMLKCDGEAAMESRRGVPTPLTSFYKVVGLCRRYPMSHTFGKYYMSYLPWDKPSQIEIVGGAFCLLRRQALDQTGLLDETFFMYGEDIDLSYRLLKGGWENWYLPFHILHYKGESTQKSSFRYVHVFYGAMLIFFRKHYAHLGWLIGLPIQLGIYGMASMAFLSMMFNKARESMGFWRKESEYETLYVFHSSEAGIARCSRFAQQHGLVAQFCVCPSAASLSSNLYPADAQQLTRYGQVYAVFDTSLFSFEDILDAMSARSSEGMILATFYPERSLLITQHDVLC